MSQVLIPHDIQVYENHAGPIPSKKEGGLRYAFIAYSDAEGDASFYGLYGYGHTEADAIADYCRNRAEAFCSSCLDCESDNDCILTSGILSQVVKARIESYFSSLYTPASELARGFDSHKDWREINKEKA